MSQMKSTNVGALMADLHGGIFEKKLSNILTQAALATINPMGGGAAKVVVTFDLSRVSQGRECKLNHSISYKIPTENGEKGERDSTNTIVYVNEGGNLTILPESQLKLELNGG